MKTTHWFFAAMAIVSAVAQAAAAEIRVISGGAAKSFVQPLADSFRRVRGV